MLQCKIQQSEKTVTGFNQQPKLVRIGSNWLLCQPCRQVATCMGLSARCRYVATCLRQINGYLSEADRWLPASVRSVATCLSQISGYLPLSNWWLPASVRLVATCLRQIRGYLPQADRQVPALGRKVAISLKQISSNWCDGATDRLTNSDLYSCMYTTESP